MKIDMNKDFEMEFQSTVIKEFTGREVGTGIVAFLSAGGVSVLVLKLTELPINVCVYFGIPVMFLVAFCGMWKIQGMTLGYGSGKSSMCRKQSTCPWMQENTRKDRGCLPCGGKEETRWQSLMETEYFRRKKN